MKSIRSLAVIVALLFPIAISPSLAGSNAKGRGALVIVDEAPVFKESTSTEQVFTLHRLDSVVGNKSFGMGLELWDFVEKDGRVRVAYLDRSAKHWVKKGWMRPADLSMFVYNDCGVQTDLPTLLGTKPLDSPWPWSAASDWTLCFQESRDAKLGRTESEVGAGGHGEGGQDATDCTH